MALTTAETGHLVISTVHAADAVETINRIIDVYPIGFKDQICAQLAGNLLGVIAQTLVPRKDRNERVLATEVMLTTTSIRNLIRRGAFTEIRGQVDSEEDEDCHSLEKSLSKMVKDGVISVETAKSYAKHPNLLNFTEAVDFKKEKAVEQSQLEAAPKQATERRPEKVLIIDLNEGERERMKEALVANGFADVSIGENGEDGWEKISEKKPDIVILDTQLYDIYAYDLCKRIKGVPNYHCKVVMVTSNLRPTDMQNSREAGADGFVIKTKAYELLIKALGNLLKPA